MIAAGVGFREGVSALAIVAAVQASAKITGYRAEALALPAFKSGEPAVPDAAQTLGLPLILVERTSLEAEQHRCVTRSNIVARKTGLASVAEAAALAAAGPEACLLLARIVVDGVTCALAG